MTDEMELKLKQLLAILSFQEEQYGRRLHQNRKERDQQPKLISLSWLDAERLTLETALDNTTVIKIRLKAILRME